MESGTGSFLNALGPVSPVSRLRFGRTNRRSTGDAPGRSWRLLLWFPPCGPSCSRQVYGPRGRQKARRLSGYASVHATRTAGLIVADLDGVGERLPGWYRALRDANGAIEGICP